MTSPWWDFVSSLPSSVQHLPALPTAPVLNISIIIMPFPWWKVAPQCLLHNSQILVSPWKFSVPWLSFPFARVVHWQQHVDACCVPGVVDVVWTKANPCIREAHISRCSHYPELTTSWQHGNPPHPLTALMKASILTPQVTNKGCNVGKDGDRESISSKGAFRGKENRYKNGNSGLSF